MKKTTQTNKHMSNTNPNFIKDIIKRTLSDFKKNPGNKILKEYLKGNNIV
jgi:hypothetical protein